MNIHRVTGAKTATRLTILGTNLEYLNPIKSSHVTACNAKQPGKLFTRKLTVRPSAAILGLCCVRNIA